MNDQRKKNERRRRGRQLRFVAEVLEARTLLTAAETFSGPSLTDLIMMARQGQDTAPAAIDRMLHSLETQLTAGPLTDLSSATVDGNGFVQEVQSLESSYEQNVDGQLSPEFPNVDELLKLAGQAIVADVISLNQQNTVGLISNSALATDAKKAIDSVTAGPITSLNTTLAGYAAATQAFEADLQTLVQSLSSGAATPLDAAQVSATTAAEAEAYLWDMHSGLEVTNPNISNMVDAAVDSLESTASSIAQDTTADALSALSSAISTFDTALLNTTGLFGPRGPISQAVGNRALTPNLTSPQTISAIGSVSGTSTGGGTATLSATLTNLASGQGISGETVDFTLDGAFAGQAVTDSDGVATLSGVATSQTGGTDSGGVVASFAGDTTFTPSNGSGDLVVGQATAALGSVSGTASFGGPATLLATLTSPSTNAGISGETVTFTLNGTSVGTASTTNATGIATLTGVAVTGSAPRFDRESLEPASPATPTPAASSATGNLNITQIKTSVGSVSGTAAFGGTATLTATLTSTATGAGDRQRDHRISPSTARRWEPPRPTSMASPRYPTWGHERSRGDPHRHRHHHVPRRHQLQHPAPGTGNLVVTKAASAVAAVSGTAPVGRHGHVDRDLDLPARPGPRDRRRDGDVHPRRHFRDQYHDQRQRRRHPDRRGDERFRLGTNRAPWSPPSPPAMATLTGSSGGRRPETSPRSPAWPASTTGLAGDGGTATLTATGWTQRPPGPPRAERDRDLHARRHEAVGTATTNRERRRHADRRGVTTDAVGTHTGGVVSVTFAGDTTFAPSTATGDLVVSQASTSLTNVSGSTTSGGTATLTATLTRR